MGARWDAITLGRRRRARAAMRKLRELDRIDATGDSGDRNVYADWRPQRRRHHMPHPRTVAIVLIIAAVVAGAVLTRNRGSNANAGNPLVRPSGFPSAALDEHGSPIGHPLAAPAGTGGFTYEATQPGGTAPVTWDPCRPIHYVTTGTPPAGGRQQLAAAIKRVSAVTGFQFIDDGATTELPSKDRKPYQPDRYGDKWAPVLVAWTTPEQVPKLAGEAVGLGGAASAGFDHHMTYVSGFVFLDVPQMDLLLDNAKQTGHLALGIAQIRATILHEFGHVLGLAHVNDPTQIMYPEEQLHVTDYGAGDLRGLHALSTGRCAPDL